MGLRIETVVVGDYQKPHTTTVLAASRRPTRVLWVIATQFKICREQHISTQTCTHRRIQLLGIILNSFGTSHQHSPRDPAIQTQKAYRQEQENLRFAQCCCRLTPCGHGGYGFCSTKSPRSMVFLSGDNASGFCDFEALF